MHILLSRIYYQFIIIQFPCFEEANGDDSTIEVFCGCQGCNAADFQQDPEKCRACGAFPDGCVGTHFSVGPHLGCLAKVSSKAEMNADECKNFCKAQSWCNAVNFRQKENKCFCLECSIPIPEPTALRSSHIGCYV